LGSIWGRPELTSLSPAQTGTLSGLLTLSEALVKHDQVTNSILAKTIETIRSLTTAQAGPTVPGVPSRVSPLSSHLLVGEGTPYFDYLFPTQKGQKEWVWNGKYRTDSRTLGEVVDGLMKELAGIDNAQRNKSGQYAVVKTALATATRKKAYAPSPPPAII
jgi:V-type H+-transporting ATPase subunit C